MAIVKCVQAQKVKCPDETEKKTLLYLSHQKDIKAGNIFFFWNPTGFSLNKQQTLLLLFFFSKSK
jgi:hypothetical protein